MNFPGVEFLEIAPKFMKGEKNYCLCVYYVLYKTSNQEVSRPSRAVTANKCTKKRAARAELLFCFFYVVVVIA